MTLLPSLRDAWYIVGATSSGPGLRASAFEGGGEIVLATVSSEGSRGILVVSGSDEQINATVAAMASEAGVLGAEVYSYFAEGRSRRGVHLWCRRSELDDAFGSFCESLVARVVGGELVYPAFMGCLEEFRTLVAGIDPEAHDSGITGLLGELVVLEDLVRLGTAAVDMWAYPRRDRHDFRNGDIAIEVKTTLRSQNGAAVINVSAIDQLQSPQNGALFLHWIRLEHDPEGSLSIRRVVESVAERLDPSAAVAFRRRVLGSRLNPRHDERFTVQERRSYVVGPSFPRLTLDRLLTGQLDAGVNRVSYQLDLSVAADFLCTTSQANETFMSGTL